jgi:hypothetical protein
MNPLGCFDRISNEPSCLLHGGCLFWNNVESKRTRIVGLCFSDDSTPNDWIADAHRGDGKRFVVHADKKLTEFLEFESLFIRTGAMWTMATHSIDELLLPD